MHRSITANRCASTFPEAIEFLRQQREVLVLCGSRAAADDLVRAACQTTLCGVHRITPAQLAATLAKPALAARGWAPLTPLAPEALAARVTHLLLTKKRLSYFGPVAGMPGFAGALASTLTELRLHGVTPKQLRSAGVPGRDLAKLLTAYETELRKRSLADFASTLELAIEAAMAGTHPLVKLPMLWLPVMAETRLLRAFLDALSAQSQSILKIEIGVSPEGPEPWDALSSLQRNLFGMAASRPADASFELFSASGEGLECVEIARRILKAGIAFDEAAILLRNPERYRPMVEEALRRARIPAHFTRGSSTPNAAGRAFLCLLACAADNLSAARFSEYLSLGQVPDGPAPDDWTAPENDALASEEPQAAGRQHSRSTIGWETHLVDAAVVGGRERWSRRLAAHAASLQLELEQSDAPEERERISKRIDRLAALMEFALPVIDLLAVMPVAASWGEWIEALTHLAHAALRAPGPVTALLAELSPMSDIGPVELAEVTAVLSDRLRFEFSRDTAPRYGGVFVGAIEEALGMSFQLVFLPGLAEGAFPHRPAEDPLLLDDCRVGLPGALSRQTDRVRREHMLLRSAVACASGRLVASYPRMDIVTGRRRVPSLYAFELVRAAEGRLPADLREFEKRANSGSASQLRWPAPSDPFAAIDDAEFDLSVLRPAFDDPGASPGRAGYLTKVNPHLYRSLQSRGRRWLKKWFAADGLVDVDVETLQILGKHLLTRRSYSPSALQHFAACPYRFYLRSIYGLRPASKPETMESMEPAVRGELFHQVQFELLRELQSSQLLPLSEQNLTMALDRLNAAVDRIASSFAETYQPAIVRIWASDVEEIRSDLRGWLRAMAARGQQWIPIRFELGFGFTPRSRATDPASTDEEIVLFDEGYRLRGSIDLVEQNASDGSLRITDHKTGAPPEKAPSLMGGGEILQPILYALAAEKLLGRKAAAGRLYYATQRHSYRETQIAAVPEARRSMEEALAIINSSIYKGFLPSAPRKEACVHCDYRPVCGPYEEERVNCKSRAELQPLFGIRRMP
ncbi:MAG TPA: PD-(D/E)XK nuclease family protein [Bryobacteraceae bacterium]|nr:PD-(D/E)XK nuclease family protein [Bryobacteraceae bacterium]